MRLVGDARARGLLECTLRITKPVGEPNVLPNLCQTPLFTQFTIGIKKKLPCYFNAGENSPVAVSPDPVSTDVLVAAADL